MKKTVKDMVEEAMAEVETISVAEAMKRQDDDAFVIVDIRDVRELDREGMIPGAFHAPRGMLEFWVDPKTPITGHLRVGQDLRLLLPVRPALGAGDQDGAGHGA